MKYFRLFLAATFFYCLATPTLVFAQTEEPDPRIPGRNHERLVEKQGDWDIVVKIWESPELPPETSSGTSEMKMIMGGRYLREETRFTYGGIPCTGIGLTGFDVIGDKYVQFWIDDISTGFSNGEGSYDSGQLIYESTKPDPDTRKIVKIKTVEERIDRDEWRKAIYRNAEDGRQYKSMEIVFTRK